MFFQSQTYKTHNPSGSVNQGFNRDTDFIARYNTHLPADSTTRSENIGVPFSVPSHPRFLMMLKKPFGSPLLHQ